MERTDRRIASVLYFIVPLIMEAIVRRDNAMIFYFRKLGIRSIVKLQIWEKREKITIVVQLQFTRYTRYTFSRKEPTFIKYSEQIPNDTISGLNSSSSSRQRTCMFNKDDDTSVLASVVKNV